MSQTTSPVTGETNTDSIDTDDQFRILAHERRRKILSALEQKIVPLSLSGLATAVVELEGNVETRDRVSLSLHHRHLPMMADAGAIDYDPEDKRITAAHTTLLESI